MIFSNSLRQWSYGSTAILAVVTSATFSAVSFGGGTDPADVWKERVDRFAKPFVEKKDGVAGLVVGIVTPYGRRAFYGYGKTKANGPQPTKDTLFEIGSVTKIFTTLILADMVEKKVVKLDDPVRLYLPADMAVPRRGIHEITLLELATHTSGLPSITPDMTVSMIVRAVAARVNKTPEDYFPDPFVHIGSEQLKRGLAEIKLDPQAKPKWSYSNLGIGLLGYCLARKEGISYDQLVRKRITGPLGLKSTMQNPSGDDLKRMATGHRGKSLPVSRLSFDALAGCGALCSSADDLLRFLDAESGRTRTKLSEAMTMTRKERASETAAAKFGMCWFIVALPEPYQLYRHGGTTLGYMSFIAFSRAPPAAVVILCNSRQETAQAGMTGFGLHLLNDLASPERDKLILEASRRRNQTHPRTRNQVDPPKK